MTSSYWQLSENLINYILPSIVLVTIFLCFILLSLWLSHGNKKAGLTILALVILNATLFISVLTYTIDYRKLTPYTTYKNRDFEISVYKKSSFSHRYINGYSENDIQNTLKLPFYSSKEQLITTSWEYLGEDKHLYFFEKDNIIYNVDKNKQLVSFKKIPKTDIIITEKYAELNDSSFKAQGFKETVGPFISSIVITETLRNKEYHPTSKTVKFADY